ncbi:NUDIX hydrolase [Pleomorphomonas sp. JP5]|uniref:NUDIX hydrolase n=1 Tax=Pleomorphomonas sp. JP5 TaxID=2942998 RepID=UPI0020441E22|nr:NUDIX hydrolase [Pleomorphomonas sp. JP5]MCM5559631.1 NUDIX hydrolase [Pleomorphomonas sp. JP5]
MITCKFEGGREAALRHVVTDNIVLRGDEVLLVKRSQRLLEGGKWALVGGFVERDETLPEGAIREILEETGYQVRDLTLLRIVDRPDRPGEDRQNISFVHFCNAAEKVGAADDESDEQRWFPLAALPSASEFAFDHFESLELFRAYRREPFGLPIYGSRAR